MTATADLPNKDIQNFTEKLTFVTNDMAPIIDSEDWNKVKLIKKALMKGDTWDTWPAGANGTNWIDGTDWADGNGIASITTNKVAKTTTVTITEDDSTVTTFDVEDWSDGAGSGDISGSGTANEIAYFTAEKTIDNLPVATYPSLAELSYVKGVTSAIQTQINWKQTTMTKAAGSDVDTGTDDAKYVTSKAIEDSKYIKYDTTETLTNKRINPRLVTAASYTTDTGTSLSVATCDQFEVTAQAGALKFNNPGWTPLNGQKLMIRVKDNGTARALTYDTQFRAIWVTLPTTTVISKTLYIGCVYNSDDTKRDILAVGQEA